MNGAPLPPEHGAPVRLIAPGWYGVANVKWLTRIEVRDTRYQGRFMARDYVTIREEQRDGETVSPFTSVGPRPAEVGAGQGDAPGRAGTRSWGRRGARRSRRSRCEIDGGPWMSAPRRAQERGAPASRVRLGVLELDWGTPAAGEHAITSRAIDVDGKVQPAPDDPLLASKKTYWESNGQITRRVLVA